MVLRCGATGAGRGKETDVIGQHAPHLEADRRPAVHRNAWIALMGVLLLALVAVIGVLVGLNLWGSGAEVPTGQELQHTLVQMRQAIGGGGFI